MSDPTASEAARTLSARRWGATRPRRLARELSARAAELSATERRRLIEALNHQEPSQPLGGAENTR